MTNLDKPAIKRLVLSLRRMLEEDYEAVLRRYGLFTDREWLPPEKLPRATPEALHERERMIAAMRPEVARIRAAGTKDERKAEQEATRWYIREAAFTIINRLVGLKCLEVRGLFPEVITTSVAYGGLSQYHRDWRAAHYQQSTGPDNGLLGMLQSAFSEVTAQIGTLFDPSSDSSVVLPRYSALKTAIERINELPADFWREDEIIGWVYQFYNAEEKETIRKRGKPRLPIEVAVINQFFTPRWVVKFLVDNTLGRLWLEMHPDSPEVRRTCTYLVPEPAAEQPSETAAGERRINLDPDSPINNPAAPARRAPKLPQELRLIDPACGTMHFGHYAFEVFTAIYRDAREQGYVPAQAALSDPEVPLAILRHNLYGVDIDLRAVQLAALSLYLKARRSLSDLGVDNATAAALPWQVNLVSADARLPANGLREQFLRQYEDDPVLQRAWRELFTEMEDIAQVGSLLRVEQRFRAILEQHRPGSVKLAEQRQPYMPGMEPDAQQLSFGDMAANVPESGWSAHRSIQDMLEHLRIFARAALDTADVNAQLFAAEAEKTLGLLDVVMQSYDVVVMNPPYGETNTVARQYLQRLYPNTHGDLYAAFFERAIELIYASGYIGALTSSTFLYLSGFEDLRRNVLFPSSSLINCLDLGSAILDDATVNTSASVIRKSENNKAGIYFRLTNHGNSREDIFFAHNTILANNLLPKDVFIRRQNSFEQLPGLQLAYWVPNSLISIFSKLKPIDPHFASVRIGMKTGEDDIFVRYWWEIAEATMTMPSRWVGFANGGYYSKYYSNEDNVVLWGESGEYISKYTNKNGTNDARLRPHNKDVYFREGITYQYISSKGFNAKILPVGMLFGVAGCSIFVESSIDLFYLLGVVNSASVQILLKIFVPSRVYQVSYVRQIPIPNTSGNNRCEYIVSNRAKEAHQEKLMWDTGNEICTRFERPWLLKLFDGDPILPDDIGISQRSVSIDVEAGLAELERLEGAADQRLEALQREIDDAVYDLYEISQADRELIERELGQRPPELVWPQMEGKSRDEKRREHVRRMLSYFLLGIMKADPDGVVPLTEVMGEETTALVRLRAALDERFGSAAPQIEAAASKILGRSVQQWLEGGEFIKWHTALYKSRPIIWQLTSDKGTYAALVYYHKLAADTLRRIRNPHIRRLLEDLEERQRAVLSDETKRDLTQARRLEEQADDLRVFDERLARVINAGYDPEIDDGVKQNILPLQEAGLLRHKVV